WQEELARADRAWLAGLLADGPQLVFDVRASASTLLISRSRLQAALKRLEVSKRRGFPGAPYWYLLPGQTLPGGKKCGSARGQVKSFLRVHGPMAKRQLVSRLRLDPDPDRNHSIIHNQLYSLKRDGEVIPEKSEGSGLLLWRVAKTSNGH